MTLRRNSVQGDEAKAFDLNPGEISTVLDLPAAFALVKLESKEQMPISSVRQEIEAGLRRDRVQMDLSKVTQKISAQFNLNYFGMSAQPDIFSTAAIGPLVRRGSTRQTSDSRP